MTARKPGSPPKRRNWVSIEVSVGPGDPKHGAVGPEAGGWWMWMLTYTKDHRLDGYVPDHGLRFLFGPQYARSAYFKALVQVGLVEVVDGGVEVHDYSDYQPLAEADAARRADARRRGLLGAKARRRGLIEPPPPPPASTDATATGQPTGQPTGSGAEVVDGGSKQGMRSDTIPPLAAPISPGLSPATSPPISPPPVEPPEPPDPAEQSQSDADTVAETDSYGSSNGTSNRSTHRSSSRQTHGTSRVEEERYNPSPTRDMEAGTHPTSPPPTEPIEPSSTSSNQAELLATAARCLASFEHHRAIGQMPNRTVWVGRIANRLTSTATTHIRPSEIDKVTAAAFGEKWWAKKNPNMTPDPSALYGTDQIWHNRIEHAGGIKPPRRQPTTTEAAFLAAW